MTLPDPAPLAQALIRCASVTPADAGAQSVLGAALEAAGFAVTRLRFGNIDNIFARRGAGGRHLCFAGHTDVVPAGAARWHYDPFGGIIEDGMLYGRGACDMKGAVAAFAAAAAAPLSGPAHGSLSLLITGDEEGEATNGTVRVLDWMQDNGHIPDFCLLGEPTSRTQLGDTIKIGRRGSLNAEITVTGRQGHAAYPQLADNPLHRLIPALQALTSHHLDAGTAWFQPSTLQLTSVDTGNPASNVTPAAATAKLNIRFNDLHSAASLTTWLHDTIKPYAASAAIGVACSGDAFLTQPGRETTLLAAAITRHTGLMPEQNTGGGTSDARFISRYCPVAEFGLTGATMHQADECVSLADLRQLTAIYRSVIEDYLA